MVALNFNLPTEQYHKTGYCLGSGASGTVYAFGPFVVKTGIVFREEATTGRVLVRRLGHHAVEVYKYRSQGIDTRGDDVGVLILAKADVPPLGDYLRDTYRKLPNGRYRRGRRSRAEVDAGDDILTMVRHVVSERTSKVWYDFHEDNLMYGLRPDGTLHWQLIDYDGFMNADME